MYVFDFPESTPLNDYESGQIRFNFTRDHAGYYKCLAINSVGSIEKLIYLAYFGKLTDFQTSQCEQVKCDVFTGHDHLVVQVSLANRWTI